jgi:predicted nucleotidyltransferase component of viral defense system
MSSQGIKNIAVSVRQRLLNQAKKDNRPFNELLQYYAMERFLYRLSKSPHAGCFILKGALMLKVWRSPVFRPTMDIDMLGRTSNDETNILEQVREILMTEVEPDGISFDSKTITSERITEDADYEGIRVRFIGQLGTAKVSMQIDIGFGDIVYPGPEEINFPTMLNFPEPKLICYSRESAIAEKFEAMVKLGEINSRMKDFYDIWLLLREFEFQGKKLAEAIRLTFQKRGTNFPYEIVAFTTEFADLKQAQWEAFRKRLKQDNLPTKFGEIASSVKGFLYPMVLNINATGSKITIWKPPGPWI